MAASTPPVPDYWTQHMPLLVEQRKEMPDVDGLQKRFVRYSSDTSAETVACGWSKDVSVRSQRHERVRRAAPVNMAVLPEALSLEIVRAPAEYAVPVKQDRRLKPAFKARVTVWHSDAVELHTTVTAHAITESEFNTLENWMPPDLDAACTGQMVERATPTELKGCTTLEHSFSLRGNPARNKMDTSGPEQLTPRSKRMSRGDDAVTDPIPFRSQAAAGFPDAFAFASAPMSNSSPLVPSEKSWDNTMAALCSLVQDSNNTPQRHAGAAAALPQAGALGRAQHAMHAQSPAAAAAFASPQPLGHGRPTFPLSREAQHQLGPALLAHARSSHAGQPPSLFTHSHSPGTAHPMTFAQPAARPPVSVSALPHPNVPAFARAPFAQEPMASAVQPRASFTGPGAAAPPAPDHGDDDGLQVAVRDYEFDKLEFARPSRMNKVFVLFSMQVAGLDILYTVFEVPTVCFCRREQKERAYGKLGVPYRVSAPAAKPAGDADKKVKVKREASTGSAPKKPCGAGGGAADAPMRIAIPRAKHSGSAHSGEGPSPPRDSARNSSAPETSLSMQCNYVDRPAGGAEGDVVQSAVREWIEERYQATALPRALTSMDIDALLELAGFPQLGRGGAEASVGKEQFADFQSAWDKMCRLLLKLRTCWIADNPHVICGFDVDHRRAVRALADQPPGSFLCRFSLSRPGNFVLVCKVPQDSVHADANSLVHGLLNASDLMERRVDVWINNFPGATHLVDVYSGRRVDKRKAFPSQYTRLQHLQELQTSSAADFTPCQASESLTVDS